MAGRDVRDPNYEADLPLDAPAMQWSTTAALLIDKFAETMGIPDSDLAVAKAATAEKVESLGKSTRAWKLEWPEGMDQLATVCGWLVEGPFHILLGQWDVIAVHLRPFEGGPQAVIRVEGASHEIMILSLDPEHPVSPEERERGEGKIIQIEVQEQVVGLTDEQAAELVELCVRSIVDGRMSPDRDWRQPWHETIAKTAEHVRFGHHPES